LRRPKNKIGAAFGSYGWSGEAPKMIHGILEEMKFNIITPPLRVQFRPDEEALTMCIELGKKIADALNSLS